MQMKKQAKKYTNTKTQIKGNEEYAEEDTPEDLEQRDRARNSWRANEVALVAVHASLGL